MGRRVGSKEGGADAGVSEREGRRHGGCGSYAARIAPLVDRRVRLVLASPAPARAQAPPARVTASAAAGRGPSMNPEPGGMIAMPSPEPAAGRAPAFFRANGPALGAAVAALAAYLVTMNRTLAVVDCGELAACAWTFGVAHPTGYPTLTLLGGLFAHALPLRPILSLNILSALLTAAGVGLLALLLARVLELSAPRSDSATTRRVIAALAALATGLMGAWWAQGTSWEVYGLHALLLPAVGLTFLRWIDRERAALASNPPGPGFTGEGCAFAFLLGLAFTNHMTTGLLAPAFLTFWFLSLRSIGRPGRARRPDAAGFGTAVARLRFLVPAFVVGFVPPYLWMMARAAAHPPLAWGAPSNFPDLLHHLRGRDYGHVMGHWFDDAFAAQFAYFTHWLPGAAGYVGLAAGLIGLVILWRRSRPLAAWSLAIFVVSVLAACSYNVNDIANYFMGAIAMIGLWSAVACDALARRRGARTGLLAAAALAATVGAVNWRANDEHDNTITEDYARNLLGPLPPGAIVLTQQWDFWESASLYLQQVEGFRRDVTVIDTESLHADWYIAQVTRAHPEVMAPVRAEAGRVAAGAERIRRGTLNDPAGRAAYGRDFVALVNALVTRNESARPVFMTYDPFGPELAPGHARIPWGLVQRLVTDNDYRSCPLPTDASTWRYRPWNRHFVPQVVWTQKLYAEACQNRAAYEQAFGRADLAARWGRLALAFDPGFTPESVPDCPNFIEQQVAAELRRFAQARADESAGRFPGWYR